MKTFFFSLLLAGWTGAWAQSNGEFYTRLDAFAFKYIMDGQVGYADLKKNPAELNWLVSKIGTMSLANLKTVEKKAFYINAYNVLVMKQIVDNYPCSSAKGVPGFFDKTAFKVAGESLTLDEIEKTRLRSFGDPRIHFALVCAAKSCPELARFAYRPATLDRQLTRQTFQSLMDKNWTRIDKNKGEISISQIFNWYKSEFPDPVAFINSYRSDEIPGSYIVKFYPFNWALNDKG